MADLVVGSWVYLDGDSSFAGTLSGVDGTKGEFFGVWMSLDRFTPTFPRCGEIRVGSAWSKNGTNQYVICGAKAKLEVTLLVKGQETKNLCCGWHQKSLLRSPLYVSHKEV